MAQAPDEWLVRTTQNVIAGPYTQAQVLALIQDRKLGHHDEVCPASGYWFCLHEQEEVKKLLGIELPPEKSESTGEEITETQTDVDGTDPAIHLDTPAVKMHASPAAEIATPAPRAMSALPKDEVFREDSRIDAPFVVRGLILFLALFTAAVIYATFKATRH